MRIRLPLAMLVTSLAVAGCGGDDAPTQEEFAKEANQVCRETEKDLENLGGGSREEVANSIDKVIEQARQASDDLLDIERPEGDDGETATKFVEGFDKELEDQIIPALEKLKTAVEENDPKAAQEAAGELQQLNETPSDRFARDIGASACVG